VINLFFFSTIVIHNSLGFVRQEVVCVRVGSPKSRIRKNSAENAEPKQQIQPVVELKEGHFVVDKDVHELCFQVDVPALGFERYEIFEAADSSHTAKIGVSMGFDAK
jgi:hypothetical protein